MSKLLTSQDYIDAAKILECEVAAIKAVASVEAGKGGGFLSNDKPKILFESRWFNKLTNSKYLKSHSHLATKRWVRNYYGGEREYIRLNEAILLNIRAALKSSSWGMFQVLGANHNIVGWLDLLSFVEDMYKNERKHLDAFVGFIQYNNLEVKLQNKDWPGFADVYNGPGYKKHNYDGKMAKSYAFYSNRPDLAEDTPIFLREPFMRGTDIKEIQKKLGLLEDGLYGPNTQRAVITFQIENNLIADGIVGSNTLNKMGL